MEAMNTGLGVSVLAGAGSAVGASWSPSVGGLLDPKASVIETGLTSPSASLSVQYSWYVLDFGNHSGG